MLPSLRRWRDCFYLVAVGSLSLVCAGCPQPGQTPNQPAAESPPPSAAESSPREVLFCFWNVENFFDDRDDGRDQADGEFDSWFAHDRHALDLKLRHLTDALLKLNDGKGPDILAIVEVESIRAAELLRDALNARLDDPTLHYRHLLMKEFSAGRHIYPAILTRLPVRGDKTQLHGHRQRILEGHIQVNGNDLVVLATHWTSRRTDKDGRNRGSYGDQIRGVYRAMAESNPAVDFLVCGDFNDTPQDDSVTRHLRAIGDRERVRVGRPAAGREPLLYNLFADKDADRFGTHFFDQHWQIFDQIVVSPGLLDDQGWTCDTDSARTINTLARPGDKKHRPWRFGSEKDRHERGVSDHFPVTVRLRVHGDD